MAELRRYLILEDSDYDAKLIIRELLRLEEKFDSLVVSTREQFIETLSSFEPDIILSDYSLGQFNGLEALEIAKVECPDIPFIVVTGSLSEETAVACMKKGAWDYVLKDKLFKLEAAINSAFKLKKEIDHKRKAEEDLLSQQYYLSKAQEMGSIGTWELDIKKNELIWTEQNYKNFGVPVGTPLTYEVFLNCVHPEDRDFVNNEWEAAINGKPYDIEHRLVVNGQVTWVREKAEVIFDKEGGAIKAIGFAQDITKHKKAEQALQHSEGRHRSYLENSPLGIFVVTAKGKYINVNPAACKLLDYTRNELLKLSISDVSGSKGALDNFIKLKEKGKMDYEGVLKRKDGSFVNVRLDATVLPNDQFIAFCTDITEHKQAKELLQQRLQELEIFNEAAIDREIAINDLRKEINELLFKLNMEAKYEIVE